MEVEEINKQIKEYTEKITALYKIRESAKLEQYRYLVGKCFKVNSRVAIKVHDVAAIYNDTLQCRVCRVELDLEPDFNCFIVDFDSCFDFRLNEFNNEISADDFNAFMLECMDKAKDIVLGE
jgi:hypothetical protein